MPTGKILLQPRPDRAGFDVLYRPHRVATMMLGLAVDDALAMAGELNGHHGTAHQIALARALDDGFVSDAREAAWNVTLLAEDTVTAARRAADSFDEGNGLGALAAAVAAAAGDLVAALGAAAGPRDELAPQPQGIAAACLDLDRVFATLTARAQTLVPARLALLSPDNRGVVEETWGALTALVERLQQELPCLSARLLPEPPLDRVLEADGVGTAVTTGGRVTYGVRVAAGYISRIAYTTPTDRLFKPGGAAVRLLDRFDGDTRALGVLMGSLHPDAAWTTSSAGAHA